MKRILTAMLGISVTSLMLFSCQSEQKGEAAPAPLDVNVVPAGQGTVPIIQEFVGQTFGESDVAVQARIDGWVESMHFREGSRVRKGQLLYTLDDQPIQNSISEAKARLAQANTQYIQAKSELDRVRPLTEMNALSRRELDAAIANEQAAAFEVEASKAGLANVNIQLDYTRVKAPISGTIGISNVQVGDYVGRLQTEPLNMISSTDSVRVRFSVREEDYLTFAKAGESGRNLSFPMELELSDGTIYTEKGRLDLVDRQIDPLTGSITVQAYFQNAQKLLKPGQYVKIHLTVQELEDAVMVPQQAIIQLQNIYRVFIVNDSNKVVPQQVQTGPRIGNNWVIEEGLTGKEKLAIIGNAAVKPGSIINPVTMEWNYEQASQQ